MRSANPVIRSDDWYYLDVFVRKAVAGQLGLVDFFARRYDADHAQPLNKLVMLLEWRWFDLDFAVGAVIGVMAAAVCAMILHRVLLPSQRDPRGDARRYLAWSVICALLFSLNASGIWTWPLVALGYLAVVPILLFLLATWQAWQHQRYLLLTLATLLLGVVADDSAMITVVATLAALLLLAFRDPSPSRAVPWKTVLVILACTVLVRIGYTLVPVLDSTPSPSLSTHLAVLHGQLQAGGAWQWLSIPLASSVAHDNPFHGLSATTWNTLQMIVVAGLLAAHAMFWWRALRGGYNKPVFVAVCLMLLSYGWLAGIIVMRVSYFGSGYLAQDRYVEFYQFNLMALLLMWASASPPACPSTPWRHWLTGHVPAAACVLLLLLQIPLAQAAWQQRRYSLPYYGQMATQIEQMSADPTRTQGCLPLLVVCQWPLERRRAALDLLRDQRLNVFSSRVQARHRFLPRWPADAEGHAP
ncbi:hypothetical protein B0E52_03100 [Rhodanobacter sp. C06]|nr:hypothetical protein B0E52_03100 [Rhodanobacter sp. C06]